MVLVVFLAIAQPDAAGRLPATEPAADATRTGPIIEGMVLNHQGAGIRGARVRIESLDAAADDPALAEGTTNPMGEILIRLPKPVRTSVRVRVLKEGYAVFVQEIDPTDEDDPPFVDATLEGTGRVSGTVTEDETGKPLARVNVRCDNGGRSLNAQTDQEGKYAFSNIYRGPARLTFIAQGFGIERSTLNIGTVRVAVNRSLRPQRPVELIIEDNAGKPAEGVTVEAMIEPTHDFLSAETDATGRTRLNGVNLDATKIRLRLNGDRYVQSRAFVKTVTLPEVASQPAAALPPVTRRFVVRIAARLEGRVVHAGTQEPIIGVRVIAGRQVRGDMPMVWTDADGRYELGGLEPGFNLISCQHLEYATAIHELRLTAGRTSTLDVKLDTGRPIGGLIVNEAGEPLDQVRVSADSWKGYETLGLRMLAGEDGRFFFPNAPVGEIAFSFVKPGYGPMVEKKLNADKTDYRIVLKEMAEADEPAAVERKVKIKIGEMVPELTMTATDGTRYKLSELRSKYVFIDCWAGWCGPCVAEIPNIKALYSKMKDRPDFVLIGVSLDRDRDAFKEALAKHEMDWPQVFGPKSGAQEVFDTLDGFAIPYTCLIGPDGTLLIHHLRGPGIVEEVGKLLREENKKDKGPESGDPGQGDAPNP